MQFIYDPFILRRFGEGRVFLANPNMPFEFFLDCFMNERPFFLVSQLTDGRIAITPNFMMVPQTFFLAGQWPQDLLPTEFEYVTLKESAYPVVITAHPVARTEEWFKKFERCVVQFSKQALADFIAMSRETVPLEFKAEFRKPQIKETIPA